VAYLGGEHDDDNDSVDLSWLPDPDKSKQKNLEETEAMAETLLR
jgi:hypothetical protein